MNLHEHYIAGRWMIAGGDRRIDIVSPASGTAIGQLTMGSPADADLAIQAAAEAFDNWSGTRPAERRAALARILEAYRQRRDDLAAAMTLEMGAPLTLARGAQYLAGEGHLEDFLGAIDRIEWQSGIATGGSGDRVLLEPMGVAVLITPWNWPMNQITLKVGAALTAGCTVVLKPSELAPLSARVFAEIVDAADLPPGVFNMVHGSGSDVGETLVRHPLTAVISLTGSTRAGTAVMEAAAPGIKRVSLELGGKGAGLIFADSDFAFAASHMAKAMFGNSGQSCNVPSRLLVERPAYQAAVAAAAKAARETVVGDPADPATQMGPLSNRAQYERVLAMIDCGEAEGARLVAGGRRRPDEVPPHGLFVAPTVFADVTNDMTIAREEIFGPVLSIIPFDTEDEAISIANDSPYGLAAYLWTSDPARGRRIARKLHSGMVRLNGTDIPFGAPFGGYRQSGIGREGGTWGIEEFLEVKAVSGWPEESEPTER
jgi:aldehyde dehydrogenase (NAD+)